MANGLFRPIPFNEKVIRLETVSGRRDFRPVGVRIEWQRAKGRSCLIDRKNVSSNEVSSKKKKFEFELGLNNLT